MTLPRVFVVMRRVLTELRRDRRTLALIVVQPIVIMAVFGYAFGGDVAGARVAVANLDRGTLARDVLAELDLEEITVIPFDTSAEAEEAFRRGDASAAVVFPANFSRNFETGTSPDPEMMVIEVYKDNTNPQITGAVLSAFTEAFADALEERTGRQPAFALDERVVYGGDEERALEFFLPGIAAFAIFQLGGLLTVITIVKERSLGTLPRVMASPVRRWEVVFGYTGAFTLLSIVQAASILAVATLVFQVPIRGSVLAALLGTTIVGLVALGFGILVSGVSRTEFQAVQSVFLFSFPMLFLSGVFAPPEALPQVLVPLMRVIPLTYGVRALREMLNHGRSLAEVAPDLAILSVFALVFLGIATLTFGRKS